MNDVRIRVNSGASDAPTLTENGSREAKYAPFIPGSDAGVAAHTRRHWVRLRTAAGARQDYYKQKF